MPSLLDTAYAQPGVPDHLQGIPKREVLKNLRVNNSTITSNMQLAERIFRLPYQGNPELAPPMTHAEISEAAAQINALWLSLNPDVQALPTLIAVEVIWRPQNSTEESKCWIGVGGPPGRSALGVMLWYNASAAYAEWTSDDDDRLLDAATLLPNPEARLDYLSVRFRACTHENLGIQPKIFPPPDGGAALADVIEDNRRLQAELALLRQRPQQNHHDPDAANIHQQCVTHQPAVHRDANPNPNAGLNTSPRRQWMTQIRNPADYPRLVEVLPLHDAAGLAELTLHCQEHNYITLIARFAMEGTKNLSHVQAITTTALHDLRTAALQNRNYGVPIQEHLYTNLCNAIAMRTADYLRSTGMTVQEIRMREALSSTSAVTDNPYSAILNDRTATCWTCGKRGHKANDCRAGARTKPTPKNGGAGGRRQ